MAPTFKGMKSLQVKLGKISAETGKAVSKAVRQSGLAIENNAVERIMAQDKTGIVYRKKGGKIHQASAPGQAPAADTGELHTSITTVMTVDGPAVYQAQTAANTPYAFRLEFGGTSASVNQYGTPKKGPVAVTIAPRPFMAPSFKEERQAAIDRIKAAAGKAAKAGSK